MFHNLYGMKRILLSLFLSSVLLISAQKQADVSLELLDGNLIKGTTALNDIELVSAYGKLTVPASKVSHIDIGLGNDKNVNEKAKPLLKLLITSNTDDVRKGAYADLIKLGPKAIFAINDFFSDPKNISEENSYTGEFTIENALAEIKATNNISDDSPSEDVITMENNYTMGGQYNFTKMEVKTEYGNLIVPKEKIKSIDISVITEAGKGEYVFQLNASKHISGNQNGGWLKTGIQLKAGQHFSINSNGEVTLASLSNNKYKPDGSVKAAGAAEFTKPYGGGEEGDYSGVTYASYGQVVYKIGEKSFDNLRAGAKFSGTAKTSGMLLISIYETVYNAGNKGTYSVKINLNK